ncbi:hypothetical protein SOPP22_12065 [Shewanella sp. OPT22]|nr:hypothetical protein SOPP22_12065 [Shewanella sp. OPT22]
MRITELALTNFKSFKQTQIIQFAPVTLLFGPNSVGKSTVLMALAYVQQILQKGQCNPQRLDMLGGKFVGGFKNLIHGRDLNSSITIAVSFDKGNYVGATYNKLLDLLSYEKDFFHNSPSEFQTAKIEFEISWSKALKTAYVSNYELWLDDEFAAAMSSDSGLKQPIIENINYLHPLLLQHNHEERLEDCFDDGFMMHEAFEEEVLFLKGYEKPTLREITKGADWPPEESDSWPDFNKTSFVSQLHELLTDSRLTASNQEDNPLLDNGKNYYFHVPLSYQGNGAGALPTLGKRVETSLSIDDGAYNNMIHEILSDLVTAPLDDLLAFLLDSLSIGPLRNIPDATYQPNPYPQQADWHNGMAAWDQLAEADISILRDIDSWISDEDKLALGYGIALKVKKQFAEFKKISAIELVEYVERQLSGMIAQSAIDGIGQVEFDEQNTTFEYALWDTRNHLDVMPSDIGVGVSQLMPLVVAALSRDNGLVSIEQPELHVHPRVQVATGDLFTQLKSKPNFLIETHSEHIILRLLRRIRETSENELPEGFCEVKADDISVVCFQTSDEGITTKRLRITDDGDFEDRWPGGFFDERDDELF